MPAPHVPHVLHVITGLGLGGAERSLVRVVGGLRSKGIRSSIVSLTDAGPLAQELLDLGASVTPLGMRRGRPSLNAALRLRRLIAERQPDLVQTWMYHADLLGLVAAAGTGVPVVWNIRHSSLRHGGASPLTRVVARLSALLSRRAAAIVVGSEAARAAHLRLGYSGARMVSIPNGFDLEEFRPDAAAREQVRSTLGIPREAPLVGLIGRLHADKGHDVFARCADLLLAGDPALHVLVAGQGTEGAAAPYAALATTGSGARLHRLGQRTDVGAVLASLDVLVSASRTEGFPNVLCEAMACAVPCVASDAGDSRRIIGEHGEVVACDDAEALARAVRRTLALSPAQRAALGAAARASIGERFSLEAMTDRYHALYARLWNEAARPRAVMAE